MIKLCKEAVMDPANKLCEHEKFLKQFNEIMQSEETLFGQEEADFNHEKITKIVGPKVFDGGILCSQIASEHESHGCGFFIIPGSYICLRRWSENQFHGRMMFIKKSGKVNRYDMQNGVELHMVTIVKKCLEDIHKEALEEPIRRAEEEKREAEEKKKEEEEKKKKEEEKNK